MSQTFIKKNIDSATIMSVTYGKGVYVIVGSSGYIKYSYDLNTWYLPTITGNSTVGFLSVRYFQETETFVAVSTMRGIFISIDGITWTKVTADAADWNIYSVIYDHIRECLVCVAGLMVTPFTQMTRQSFDGGITWSSTNYTLSNTNPVFAHDMIFFNNLFIIATVGQNSTAHKNGGIRTAPNLATTPYTPRFADYRFRGITHNNSLVVAVGDTGKIASSLNGTTWTARTSGTTQNLMSVKWFKNKFYAVGFNGTILTSSDGVTWENKSLLGITDNFYEINIVNNRLFIVGTSGIYLYSPFNKVITRIHDENISIDSDTMLLTNSTDFMNYGNDDFSGYDINLSKVSYEMDEATITENGRILSQQININDFEINSMGVK